MSERLSLPAEIRSEISNLLASFVYYQAICTKLASTLKKLEASELEGNFSVTRLVWMIFVFVQGALAKSAGNLNESLCLLAAVVLTFLERLRVGPKFQKGVDSESRQKLLQLLRVSDSEVFRGVLKETREQLEKMESRKLVPGEWNSFESVEHSLRRFEALYAKQLVLQDINMTHFLTKVQRVEPSLASPLPPAKETRMERPREPLSPLGKSHISAFSKKSSFYGAMNSPKTKKRTQSKIEQSVEFGQPEVETLVRQHLASFLEGQKAEFDLSETIFCDLRRTINQVSLNLALQQRLLAFHVRLLKELGRNDFRLFQKLTTPELHALLALLSSALFVIDAGERRAALRELFKAGSFVAADLMRLIEESPAIPASVPRELNPKFLELRRILVSSLLWAGLASPERTLKANEFLAPIFESHVARTITDIATHAGVSREQAKTARDICIFVLNDMPRFVHRKHLDQLVLCALYSACKLARSGVKFRALLSAYRQENPADFDEVAYSGASDIIALYNEEFVPVLSAFLARGKENFSRPALNSPASPGSPSLKPAFVPPVPKSTRVLNFEADV